MSSYTIYDPNQALEQSRARRQMAMQRLMQMQQAKQAYTNEQQRLLEKQQKEMEAAQNKRVENESSLGWGGGKGMFADTLIGGLSGAAMGFAASGFNPMGAAGGAVAGALTGGYKGFTERDEAKDYGKFMQPYSGPSPMAMGQVGGQGMANYMGTRGNTTLESHDTSNMLASGGPSEAMGMNPPKMFSYDAQIGGPDPLIGPQTDESNLWLQSRNQRFTPGSGRF